MIDAWRWPLVGRERELELIVAGYDRMATRGAAAAAGAVIVGRAGCGRTRLARAALEHLAARGAETVWATANRSAAAVPLGALAHLMPHDADAGDLPGAISAMIAWFDNRYRTCGRPLVLVVDDAHTLDDASAAVVHHLAAGGHGFVLLTLRAGEPVPDAVTALWMDGTATRVDLPALDDDSIVTVLSAALGSRPDPVSELRLVRLVTGSPLLLREVLRAGRETGTLCRSGGAWRWRGTGYVTEQLRDVIGRQAGFVPDDVVAVVEPLALAGPVPLAMLVALAGHDRVVTAERRRLVVVEHSGRRRLVRLTHPVHAAVVRASIPVTRERQVWAHLAGALAETPRRRREDEVLGALWRLRAGLPVTADMLAVAAGHALKAARVDRAGLLADAAAEAGGGWLADLALAETHAACGRHAQAAAALPALDDGRHRTSTLRARWCAAGELIGYLGGASVTGPLSVFEGRCEAVAAGGAGPAAVLAAGLLGRSRAVLAGLDRGHVDAEAHQESDPVHGPLLSAAGSIALLAVGRAAAAAELARRGYRQAAELAAADDGMAALLGVLAAVDGIVAKAQGRITAAIRALTQAVGLLDGRPSARLAGVCLAELAGAHGLAGNAEAAADGLRRALAHPDRPPRLFDAWIERDRAWVVAASGDLAAAAAHCRHAAELAHATQQPAIAGYALYDAARLGDGAGVGAELADLAGELDTTTIQAMAGAASALHAAGAAPHAAAPLDRAVHAFTGTGLLLHAAEAAFAASRAHAGAGRRTKAEASRARALALVRDCTGARTPLLAETGTGPLTRRESHVATLAAAGMSGPRIATELGLSVRTVNNHLGRVYAKLGVGGRGGLAELLNTPVVPIDR